MVTLEVSVWDNSNYPITNITVTFPTITRLGTQGLGW
jgi:hypothetical protein